MHLSAKLWLLNIDDYLESRDAHKGLYYRNLTHLAAAVAVAPSQRRGVYSAFAIPSKE